MQPLKPILVNAQFIEAGRKKTAQAEAKPRCNLNESFKWNRTLQAEMGAARTEMLNLPKFAPINAFNEAFLRHALLHTTQGTLIEVELSTRDRTPREDWDKDVKAVWIAEILHMAGYYFLARWLGTPKADAGFWVHAANAVAHPVGWHEWKENRRSSILVPPDRIIGRKTPDEWKDFVLKSVDIRYTVVSNYDDEKKADAYKARFHVGDRLEIVHEDDSTCVIPALVKKIIGRRVFFAISKEDVDKEDFYEKDNLWRDHSDDLLYYVGFAAEQGYNIRANKRYKEHTERIAEALKNGTEPPYDKRDVSREKLKEWRENPDCDQPWEEDMLLEIMDRIDMTLYGLKPARVLKVMKHGYLQVGPEGNDIEDDSFAVHASSTILFPVGYAEKHDIAIIPPNDRRSFSWSSCMRRTGFKAAPDSFFRDVPSCHVPFKAGMRLEAADQVDKSICPVTLRAVKGRMLLIQFDGWDDSYDQLYDYRSHDIFPIGWCAMHGVRLKPPHKKKETHDDGGQDGPVVKKLKK